MASRLPRGYRTTKIGLDDKLNPSMIIDDLPFIPAIRKFVVGTYRQLVDGFRLLFSFRSDLLNIVMALFGLAVMLIYFHYKKLLPERMRRKRL